MNGTELQMILPEIPRVFTAFAEWLACILCIMEMKRRITGWKFVSVCGLALIIQAVFLELTNGLSPIVLTPVDDKEDFSYMILPVRIKNS